jgi:Hypervirulence associated proteins TUDOR domain
MVNKTNKSSTRKKSSGNTSSLKQGDLKQGDKVEWETSQGKTKGTVKKKVTRSMKIKGHTVKASKENPQVLVKSDKTGKQAAHKAKSLKKVKL